jgi:hypothetical protein
MRFVAMRVLDIAGLVESDLARVKIKVYIKEIARGS